MIQYAQSTGKVNPSQIKITRQNRVIRNDGINPRTLSDAINEIRSDTHKKTVDTIRAETDKTVRRRHKANYLPAYLFSGSWSDVSKFTLSPDSSSGLVTIDIDTPEATSSVIQGARQDDHVAAAYVTPSGGSKVLYIVTGEVDYLTAWESVVERITAVYDITREDIDKGAKDEKRRSFSSYDPDAYLADSAIPFQVDPSQIPKQKTRSKNEIKNEYAVLAECLDRINSDDYEVWRNVIFAVAHEYGDDAQALTMLDEWSGASNKYDPDELSKIWKSAVTGKYQGTPVTMGTVRHLAGLNGKNGATTYNGKEFTYGQDEQDIETLLRDRHHDIIKDTPKPTTIVSYDDIPLVTCGSLSVMKAVAGSGKSHVMADVLSVIAGGESSLGFNSENSGKVVYIDCEQHPYHFVQLVKNAPEGMDAYCLSDLCPAQIKDAITHIITVEQPSVIAIDGYADMMMMTNDEASAVALCNNLKSMAIENNVAIIGVMHLTPSSDNKSRGHLGSELERRAETVLQVQVDNSSEKNKKRTIWASKTRGAPLSKENGIRMQWSDDAGKFIATDSTEGSEKKQYLIQLIADVAEYTGAGEWSKADIIYALQNIKSVEKRQAQRYFRDFVSVDLIHETKKGRFSLTKYI